MDRNQKIQFLKDVQIGKINVNDLQPKKLDLVFNYPELPEQAYHFINEERVTGEQYVKELERQRDLFGKPLSQVHIGNCNNHRNPDPLPKFCKTYIGGN